METDKVYINNSSKKLSSHDLKRLGSQGILWSGGSTLILNFSRFVIIAVLAHLLSPRDFGIFGMAYVFVELGMSIADFGLGNAVVQKSDISESHLSTTFWTVLIGSFSLYVLLIIIAPLVASFYKEPLIEHVLPILSLAVVMQASASVHNSLLRRNMRFKSIAISELCSMFTFAIVAISLAILKMGAWTIVIGFLAQKTSYSVGMWVCYSWRPRLRWHKASLKDLYKFGLNVTGERIAFYISDNIDYFLIGRLLGATALGYYTLAFELTSLPMKRFSAIIASVSFPAFSMIKEELARLRAVYKKIVKYVSLITFPLLIGLLIGAPEFIQTIYGPHWHAAIQPVQILCLAGMLRSIARNNGSILYAVGRPDIAFKWSLARVFLIILPIIVGARYGINGVAGAVTIMIFIFFMIIQTIINKLIKLPAREFLQVFKVPVVMSITVIIVLLSYKSINSQFLNLQNHSFLICMFVIACLACLGTLCALFPKERDELKEWALAAIVRD